VQKKNIQSWEVSDEFWKIVEPLIPKPQRDRNKKYRRKSDADRKPLNSCKVFEAIIYVLRTGIQWKALPKERFGSSSPVHAYFRKWEQAGFFLVQPFQETLDTLWKKTCQFLALHHLAAAIIALRETCVIYG